MEKQARFSSLLGKGREMVSPFWFMEEMGKRRLRIGGKDGKPE